MIRDHGYSIRRLAEKLGKDKGYVENRLRLADAPPEVRQLVSVRKDTLSHAYELLKVEDPRKRRRLAEQVARGELSLVKLRDKIEGRRPAARDADDEEQLPLVPVMDPSPSLSTRPTRPSAATPAAGRSATTPSCRKAAAGGRCGKPRRGAIGARRHRVDRRRRPGQPCEVPDHRKAQAGERDRVGAPQLKRAPVGRPPGPTIHGARPPPAGSSMSGRWSERAGLRERPHPAGANDADAGRLAFPRPLTDARRSGAGPGRPRR